MAYVPNADDTGEPTGSQTVKSAAPEFRSVKTKLARALTVPEAGEYGELPDVAGRAGKVLAFDSLGGPIAVAGVTSGTAAALTIDLANKTSLSLGAGLVGYTPPTAGEGAISDLTVQKRIHLDYMWVSDVGGTDPTGTVDNRDKLLAATASAVARNKLVRVDGTYRCDGTWPDNLTGVVGDGERASRIICNASDLFTFSNGVLDRKTARFENFTVDSLANSCDAKFVFKFDGVASGAAAVYNSGVHIKGINVGRIGRFGGFAYIKDVFGAVIEDITGTNLSTGIQIVGSVVQTEIRNFKSNNDSAATTLARYGLSTESATYSGATVMVPENVIVDGLKFIRCARAVNHQAGIFAQFNRIDTEADEIGVLLNAESTLTNSLVAPGIAAVAWVGVYLGIQPAAADSGYWVDNIDVKCLRVPSDAANSYGIQVGDGAFNVFYADLNRIRIHGSALSLRKGVYARKAINFFLEKAVIRSETLTAAVEAVDISGQRLYVNKNLCSDVTGATAGTFTISDAAESTATGEVKRNQCTTLAFTPTTPNNWDIDKNEALKRFNWGSANISDGGTIAHGLSAAPTTAQVTSTNSGEFASITAIDATNLTVAVKKHDGTAGTAGSVFWEARY